MGVAAKGISAAQNKAAVRGVSGVQGSPIDHKKSDNCSVSYEVLRPDATGCVWNQSPVQALHSDRNGQVGQFRGLGAG